MRCFAICVLLASGVLLFASSAALAQEATPPAPPAAPTPSNKAEAVKLETVSFPEVPDATFTALVLRWETSITSAADQYRYHYWKLGDKIPEPGQEENIVSIKQSHPIAASELTPGAKYFWRVRACSDINEVPGIQEKTECGEYSDPSWSFVFLLNSPEITEPSGGKTGLPVRFEWREVTGAESYTFWGEIDSGKAFWRDIVKFLDDPGGWLFRFAVVDNILGRLGLKAEAVRCPHALWDETSSSCAGTIVNKDKESGVLPTEYTDASCTFTKDTKYRWKIASCLGPNATFCGNYSKGVTFETNNLYNGEAFLIPPPTLVEPGYIPSASSDEGEETEVIPVVGFTDRLTWKTKGAGDCAHFHKVIITRESDGRVLGTTQEGVLDAASFNLDFDLKEWGGSIDSPQEQLWQELNETYTWQAQPCYIHDPETLRCEPGAFSELWKFKTAGALVANPFSEVSNAVALSWDRAEKVGSYKYQVALDESFEDIVKEDFTRQTSTALSYPDVIPQTDYWWRVASCVDTKGVVCGEQTKAQAFTTPALTAPILPKPEKGKTEAQSSAQTSSESNPADEIFLPKTLAWDSDPSAPYYHYQVDYVAVSSEETLEGCAEKAGTQTSGITNNTSLFFNEKCQGTYVMRVRACIEKTCSETDEEGNPLVGPWSADWEFRATTLPAQEGFSLVPCGRNSDNEATPYNEREACGAKHLGFLIQNIADFLLWRLSLLILVALSVFVAALPYLSPASPDILARIRSAYRSYLSGVLVLLFAWAIVNIIMGVLGFSIEFFGTWYEIPL